jgi:NAD(P)-dependent dehydrogenase (short-subunit alcohol dehydrogenase family)
MAAPDFSGRPIADLISLRGRCAIVTGGARGIGASIASRMAEAGASVAVGDLDENAARATANDLSDRFGVSVIGLAVDVRVEASVESLAAQASSTLGGLDIRVNNAGIYPSKNLLEMSTEEWDRVLDVDLRGAYLGARTAARHLVDTDRPGVILNVASTASFRAARPGIAHYVSAKHGVIGLTKSLAVELGPHGIRVLAVAPTLIDTPGIRESGRHAQMAELYQRIGQDHPLGRAGVADDVARVALFCVSDLAALMTGSVLLVDAGGMAG